uniref:Transcription factor MYB59 n=1 Tax=Rhizophora mucronata TaxID=61149 RepID=A0A2P2LS58_RHIMU
MAKCTGLNRSGKSYRLIWVNYVKLVLLGLKKRSNYTLLSLHAFWG